MKAFWSEYFKEACSAFTRVTACTLALSPIRDTLTRGVSHFVTSMTAPVASGWSGCRVGLAPTEERRLVTAHTRTDIGSQRLGSIGSPFSPAAATYPHQLRRVGVLVAWMNVRRLVGICALNAVCG